MLTTPLAPYLLWAKTREAAAIDLAGSTLLACTLDDLPGAREAFDMVAPNDKGYAPLVAAIAAHYGTTAGHVATAAGCSGANFITIAALAGAGDHVLMERPGYDPLPAACQLVGARVEFFDRRFEQHYKIDLDDLGRRLTPATRLIIVSTPHNPSGAELDREALLALGRLADRVGAHVLVDEVYLDAANLVRGDPPTTASAAKLDGPFVVTNSLTKSYGLSGARSGWMIASPAIAERLRRTRDVVDNLASAPADHLAAFAFAKLRVLSERTRSLLAGNLDRAKRYLALHPQLEVAVLPECSIIFPRVAGCADTDPFVKHLVARHGVAVAPGRFFDAPPHIRISLAGATETLEAGLARLGQALGESWR
jgi:aspartate/methionine/tyrosine aminotransferase